MHTTRTVNGKPEEVVATYDAADRITKMILQGGLVTHAFRYDSLGRLVWAHDEDIGARTMTYDDNNWLRTHSNGAEQSVA
ncbi:MAG: RHS repeat protein [Myxococcales bacterium]|jgi:YD repeat-containing protein|nr:RHS repeat protein [Myxococcales bacterium]